MRNRVSFKVSYFIPPQINYQFGDKERVNSIIDRHAIVDILSYIRTLVGRNGVIVI